ncbi:MAG: M61 family peptidase [Spirosomataceae bacterium]
MIRYTLSVPQPSSRLLHLEMYVTGITTDSLMLQLPAWRPGRYELQHFAKNIQRFEVIDSNNQPVAYQKVTKDRWVLQTSGCSALRVCYTYYANKQDAGNSYVDDTMLYVNFVNCLPYIEGRMHEPHQVALQIPEDYRVACGLNQIEKHVLQASDYYQLVDSPMLASAHLQHDSYQCGNTTFHCWFLGDYEPDFSKLKRDFKRFTEAQIQAFGEFPETEYHFLNWMLPTAFYHGVEHRNSTMIVLGPAMEGDGLYLDLLGVSSHELYHTWNICRIRPVEMVPYDFTKENYFSTGFVAEGVTTYMGDLFLVQSGVFSLDDYLKELGTTLKRHFEKDGRAWQSLAESSFDLWLDGYVAPVPNRRVSIYNKGAVIALLLDLHLRRHSDHTVTLHSLMQQMWAQYGKPFVGYSLDDYLRVAEQVVGSSLDWYKTTCVLGNQPLETLLNSYLAWVGLQLDWDESNVYSLRVFNEQNPNLRRWLCLPQ